MSVKNNTTKSKGNQYHHLTLEDRIKIETLSSILDENGKRVYNNSYIANLINKDRSTVSRELRKRIKSKIMIRTGHIKNLPYSANKAQEDYLFKRSLSKCKYKLEKYPKMAKFIKDKIRNDKWSPDAVIGYMKTHNYFNRDGFAYISTQSIYYALRNNIAGFKLTDSRRMKETPEYEYHDKKELPESKQDYSINKRPDSVNKRLVFGHFELDTVIGTSKGKHECLMTLTERKTRYEMIFKLKCKTSEEVVRKFNQIKKYMKRHFDKVFKSLSTDNGTEFSDFLNIIKDTKAQIYFCHPYCSGEKGTNEKSNSIIRYFIPKKTLIENYSNQDINKIAEWMNNYPRKILNYKTPLEALLEEFNDKSVINKLYKLQEKVNC